MDKSSPERSSFVTVLAWIFIVLSGFGSVIGILQNVMVQVMFNRPGMLQAFQTPPPGAPAPAVFMMEHFRLFVATFLVLSLLMLVSSIGLLRRRNWARRIFIGLMSLGIVWNLGGLIVQLGMFSPFMKSMMAVPGAPDMKPFFIAMVVFSVLLAVGFSVLFGWIIKRLISPAVAAEFKA